MADIEAIHTYEGTETMQTLIVGRDITGIGAFKQHHTPRRPKAACSAFRATLGVWHQHLHHSPSASDQMA